MGTTHLDNSGAQNELFNSKFANYNGNYLNDNQLFDVEALDINIDKMDRGKAAGIDGLVIEHFKFAHLIIVSLLVKLFNYMLICGTVPKVFGSGFSVPIPKLFTTSLSMNSEAFHCITYKSGYIKAFQALCSR